MYYDLVRAPVDAFINKISHNNLLLFQLTLTFKQLY